MNKKLNTVKETVEKNYLPLLFIADLCLTLVLLVLVFFLMLKPAGNAGKSADYVTKEQFDETVSGLVNDFGDVIRSQQERLDALETTK